MLIPNFSFAKIVNEDGTPTDEFAQFLIQLSTQLQLNLGNEGYIVPQQTTANIALLTDADKSTAAIIYDSTLDEFKGNVAGTWKVFTLT